MRESVDQLLVKNAEKKQDKRKTNNSNPPLLNNTNKSLRSSKLEQQFAKDGSRMYLPIGGVDDSFRIYETIK